jgi:hypothetical protein
VSLIRLSMFSSCSQSHFLTLEFCRPPGNDQFLVLMVFSSYIKCVFQLVIILFKRCVSIDERKWSFVVRASRLTCQGGIRGEF